MKLQLLFFFFAGIRIGHTRVTHSYLLLGEEQLQFVGLVVMHHLQYVTSFCKVATSRR